MRNYRTETEIISTTQPKNKEGIKTLVIRRSYIAYEEDCQQCGVEYTSKGLLGGLTEAMFGKLCSDCRPKPQD